MLPTISCNTPSGIMPDSIIALTIPSVTYEVIVAGLITLRGEAPHEPDGRGPVGAQLAPRLTQVGGVVGADEQPHRVAAVELGLDVGHDVDPVDHEAGDHAVDDDVLHDDADHA